MPLINREYNGNILLIDSKYNGVVLLIDSEHNSNILLIDRKLVELENNAECASLPKLTKLVKKPSNLTRLGKKKSYRPIFYFLACFVKLVGRPCFSFVEGLADLTNGLAIGRAELRRRKVAVGFSE